MLSFYQTIWSAKTFLFRNVFFKILLPNLHKTNTTQKTTTLMLHHTQNIVTVCWPTKQLEGGERREEKKNKKKTPIG